MGRKPIANPNLVPFDKNSSSHGNLEPESPKAPKSATSDVSSPVFTPSGPMPGSVQHLMQLAPGMAGDVSIILHTTTGGAPSTDRNVTGAGLVSPGSPAGILVPKKRVMKEIPNSSKTKVSREHNHFLRDPNHPNMIKYAYFGPAVGKRSTTHSQVQMELMDLGSLRRVLRKTNGDTGSPKMSGAGNLTALERLLLAVNVSYPMVAGLDYFHHFFGGMHRDVKPDNLLISSDGKVKLCDFDTSIGVEVSAHTQIGTAMYLAPEVVFGEPGDKYDQQCDVWMAGMVIHEMATGQVPFQGLSMIQVSQREFDVPYELLRTTLEKAVTQATQKIQAEEASICPHAATEVDAVKKWMQAKQKNILRYRDLIAAAPHLESLLSRMLVREPTQRATTCEVLKHPFFSSVVTTVTTNPKVRELEDQLKAVGIKMDGTCAEMMGSWRRVVESCAAYEAKKREGKLQPGEACPLSKTSRIQCRNDVNLQMKSILLFRQRNSVQRLKAFLHEHRMVCGPLMAGIRN